MLSGAFRAQLNNLESQLEDADNKGCYLLFIYWEYLV